MRDIDIRQELHKNYLSHFYQNDSDSKVIDELGICQGESKVDIAVVNGHMWGWEIKSERDTLERLPSQMGMYNKVFDFITIVTNENHLAKIKDLVPEFWGILCVKKFENDFKLENHRSPSKNTLVDPNTLVQLLWKDEALEILEKEGLAKGMKSKSRIHIWNKMAESLTLIEINSYVREYLKKREKWRSTDLQLPLGGG